MPALTNAERWRMVQSVVGLIVLVAKRHSGYSELETQDLIQIGELAAFEALARWDDTWNAQARQGLKVWRFVRRRVEGEIMDAVWPDRRYWKRHGRRKLLIQHIEAMVGDSDGDELVFDPPDERDDVMLVVEGIAAGQWFPVLWGELNPQEREVLAGRVRGLRDDAIGAEMGVTASRICQVKAGVRDKTLRVLALTA